MFALILLVLLGVAVLAYSLVRSTSRWRPTDDDVRRTLDGRR